MSNLIEDIRIALGDVRIVDEYNVGEEAAAAYENLRELVAAYDALAPDWNDAPEWARWYAIDGSSQPHWFETEPYCDDGEGCCWCPSVKENGELSETTWAGHHWDKGINLCIGIDWRLCIWQRPA